MRPVKTAKANLVYHGPSPEIGDLWVERVTPGEIRSTWEPTAEERELLAAGGRVELALFSEPIPPISLVVRGEEESHPVDEHAFRIEEET